MGRQRRILAAWGLLVFSVARVGSVAEACSCRPPSPEEAFKQADEVFQGVVEQAEEARYTGGSHEKGSDGHITLRVERVWKGTRTSVRQIVLPFDDDCGSMSFVTGQSYLVYANNSRVFPCTRTRRLKDAREDFNVLGVGTPAISDASADTAPLVLDLKEAERACAQGRGRAFFAPYHGRRVSVQGIYKLLREHSALGPFSVMLPDHRPGTLWLEFSNGPAEGQRLLGQTLGFPNRGAAVEVVGVLESESGQSYGHKSAYDAQLRVERITQIAVPAQAVLNLSEEECRRQPEHIPLGSMMREWIVSTAQESGGGAGERHEEEHFVYERCIERPFVYQHCEHIVRMPSIYGGSSVPKECRCCAADTGYSLNE